MTIDLASYREMARDAVKVFWGSREAARRKHIEAGRQDQGERSSVTAGKNMEGFVALVLRITAANGLSEVSVMRERRLLTLPGYFRPTKVWDLLVVHHDRLVAAMEFKSQVGPSFGNNANNRAEEVIGSAADLWQAYRQGAFGRDVPKPFVGYVMLLEDAKGSRSPVREHSPHFAIFPEFRNASYAERYNILCRKLVQEQLYTATALILSPRSAADTGEYTEMSELTNLRTFVTSLAGHVAVEAARLAG